METKDAMTDRSDQDHVLYEVVVNDEEQYSIWRASRPAPAGWEKVGFQGSKAEALDHIEKVWTDITPRSVREAVAASREGSAE